MIKLQSYFLLCCLIVFSLSAEARSAVGELQAIRVTSTAAHTRILFTFSKPVQTRVFSLAHPHRVVLDVERVRIPISLKKLAFPTAQVKSMRTGFPRPTVTRFVFELTGLPSFHLQQLNRKQLILELSSADYFIRQSPENPAKPLAKKTMTTEQTTRTAVIVIDAGHGGKDPGTIGRLGTREKDVVLQVSKRLVALINQQGDMRAVLTRDGDYFVPLRNRLRLARKGKGDIFIAIHADSFFTDQSRGVSIFALSQRGATSEAARWLARRENYSELGGVDLGELDDQSYMLRSVLIDLAQTATINDSLRLGSAILRSVDDIATLHYRHVEQAPFMVLKSPDIPSVLIEIGFLSNPKEEMRLRNPTYQTQLAEAIKRGIQQYLDANPSLAHR